MTWGLYSHSHWQGSGPDRLIATGPEALCRAAEDALSSCSFCTPGRTARYSVGDCYAVRRVRYQSATCRCIPDEAAEWEHHDWHAWLHDADADCAA